MHTDEGMTRERKYERWNKDELWFADSQLIVVFCLL